MSLSCYNIPGDPTYGRILPYTIKTEFYILQKAFVMNSYMHQKLQVIFRMRNGRPRFWLRILNSSCTGYVDCLFTLEAFYDIPQGERYRPFGAWIYKFQFRVTACNAEEDDCLISGIDACRAARTFALRRLYLNRSWSQCLFEESLGPNLAPPLLQVAPLSHEAVEQLTQVECEKIEERSSHGT